MLRVPLAVAWLVCSFAAGCTPAATISGAPDESPAEEKVPTESLNRRALLVGCTKYDNRRSIPDLEGPANDVALMKRLLVERFQFEDEGIAVLCDTAGPDRHPTRHRIHDEFQRLAKVAKSDDQILILLAGHGSQQPDQNPPDPQDPEPDGMDETFLPADVGVWDGGKRSLQNAILDDELRLWTKAILAKGAYVTVILDCCCSGTALRGEEVSREVSPKDLGVPQEAIAAASRTRTTQPKVGETSPGRPRKDGTMDVSGDVERLTVLYASQSSEPTVELPLPADAPDAIRHGLFTFTLCQVLGSATEPLSGREAVRRVWSGYERLGRLYGPVPLIEGGNVDRTFLGTAELPHVGWVRLKRSGTKWRLNAGQLSGLTRGSVLAVCPATADPAQAEPAGYVEIVDCGTLASTVRPCGFEDHPVNEKLPAEGLCRLAQLEYGELALKVAVDRSVEASRSEAESLADQLGKESQKPEAMFQVVPNPEAAQWVIRRGAAQWLLLPTAAWRPVDPARVPPGAPRIGFDPSERLAHAMATRLNGIARAQNLISIAAAALPGVGVAARTPAKKSDRVEVEVEMRQFRDKSDTEGRLVKEANPVFRAGDWIGWKIRNRGAPADVTLLFINSKLKVEALFPETDSQASARLTRDSRPLLVGPFDVTEDTVGPERIVTIAVRARGPLRIFTMLAEPSLVTARAEDRRGVLKTGLGALLERSQFGTARGLGGLGSSELDDCQVSLATWIVAKSPNGLKRDE